jgi:hypothetical protein
LQKSFLLSLSLSLSLSYLLVFNIIFLQGTSEIDTDNNHILHATPPLSLSFSLSLSLSLYLIFFHLTHFIIFIQGTSEIDIANNHISHATSSEQIITKEKDGVAGSINQSNISELISTDEVKKAQV